jgi:hypothetical protein
LRIDLGRGLLVAGGGLRRHPRDRRGRRPARQPGRRHLRLGLGLGLAIGAMAVGILLWNVLALSLVLMPRLGALERA